MSVKILSSSFVISSPNLALCPDTPELEYVFIGRSNVGKSSLINAITDKKQLAKTSGQPGKTQLINYFHIESMGESGDIQFWHLVDLPGYGYAKVTREERAKWESMISSYLIGRIQIAHVFVLVDSRITPQKLDIEFVSKLHDMGKSFSLVYTKADKVNQKETSEHVKMMMKELQKLTIPPPDFYITSAEKRHSTTKLIQSIHGMNRIYTV